MEAVLHILGNIGLGLCGILFYSLWNSRKHFTDKSKEWQFPVFIRENIQTWVFNLIIIALIAIIVYTVPEVFDSIKNLTGLELSDKTPGGFFTLGILMIPMNHK